MFTVAWLDERRKRRRDLQTVRGLLAANINENTGLRAQLALCRHKLGLERIAHQVEIRRHRDTLEHLRLTTKANARLEWEVAQYKTWFWRTFDEAMPGLTDGGDE
jgi:ribosomal protein L30/L7E